MTNKPPISQVLTQVAQTILVGINKTALKLKSGAKVAELKIQDAGMDKPDVYPLLGDRYVIGRSGKTCDIVVRNPVVSQIHVSIERDSNHPESFIIKDENSTNGMYFGKRRIEHLPLRHGDVVTLGPPDLAAAVTIRYSKPPSLPVRLFRYALYGFSGAFAFLSLFIGIAWMGITVDPLPQGVIAPVVVYAGDGQTALNPVRKETHQELDKLSDFGKYIPNAVIASEDSRFYWHLGVDPIGIIRAIFINYQGQDIIQGGSTLTQQLARSIFPEVGRENTLGRKLREMLVALKVEATYSKKEILRTYLNRVYLGVSSYGFEDAARFFFDKSAKDLSLSEAATIVAILPAPNSYNPVQDYDTAVSLRNRVINRMLERGMVDKEVADKARRSRIEVSQKARDALGSIVAPYFYSYVFDELRFLLGEDLAKEGNFIVETGLNLKLQQEGEIALRNQVRSDGSIGGATQGAFVTVDARTGEILALAGGIDYSKSQFNRATSAKRQPGSTFKVFAYAAALEQGVSPYKLYSCSSVVWNGQRFKGCERSIKPEIDMFEGLANSENSVAMRVAQEAGIERVKQMAIRSGITSELNAVPGLVLGQSEVTLLELTGAYGTFANDGVWNRPHAINRILDAGDCSDPNNAQTCREIYVFNNEKNIQRKVFSKEIAGTMTDLMQSVIINGTGKAANIGGIGEAGKTGTTNQAVDLWFVGYIPSKKIVTGVWLGNDDNKPTWGSSSQPAAVWGNYMKNALGDKQQRN